MRIGKPVSSDVESKGGCFSFAAKWCSVDEKGCYYLNLGMVVSARNAGTWETGRRMECSKPA